MSAKPSRGNKSSDRPAFRPWLRGKREFLNIGKVWRRWLYDADIKTMDDLKKCGAARAYRLIRAYEADATIDLLWALEGAIQGISWRDVPAERKAEKARLAQFMAHPIARMIREHKEAA